METLLKLILLPISVKNIILNAFREKINYYVKGSEKMSWLVNKKIALLEKKPDEFNKIINHEPSIINEKEYLIKFSEKQTKLFDYKNKALVKEPIEAKQIIKQLNIYINKLEPKKEYSFAVYR